MSNLKQIYRWKEKINIKKNTKSDFNFSNLIEIIKNINLHRIIIVYNIITCFYVI